MLNPIDNDITISIIIPSFNVENFIFDCLDSIFSQTILPNEVILIDDGSTDRTLDIASCFLKHNNFRILKSSNYSQGPARYIGLMLANSDYLWFVDADDSLYMDSIEYLKETIQKQMYPDIICFSCSVEYTNLSNDSKNIVPNYVRPNHQYYNNSNQFLYNSLFDNSFRAQPCLYISKRSLWTCNKIQFPNFQLEDEVTTFEIMLRSNNLYSSNKKLYIRNYRSNSTMTDPEKIQIHSYNLLRSIIRTIDIYESCKKWPPQYVSIFKLRIQKQTIFYLNECYRNNLSPNLLSIFIGFYYPHSLRYCLSILQKYISALCRFF